MVSFQVQIPDIQRCTSYHGIELMGQRMKLRERVSNIKMLDNDFKQSILIISESSSMELSFY